MRFSRLHQLGNEHSHRGSLPDPKLTGYEVSGRTLTIGNHCDHRNGYHQDLTHWTSAGRLPPIAKFIRKTKPLSTKNAPSFHSARLKRTRGISPGAVCGQALASPDGASAAGASAGTAAFSASGDLAFFPFAAFRLPFDFL